MNLSTCGLLTLLALLPSCIASSSYPDDGSRIGNDLVFHADFTTQGSIDEFYFSDPDAWTWSEALEGTGDEQRMRGSMELKSSSSYRPPFRSPHSIALVKHLSVEDFVLEFEVTQTGREYGHRDLCFFFGFQDAAHYYYVHLASSPDPNSHNVFVVDGAARRSICEVPESGIDWGEPGTWHKVRIERTLEQGQIRVWFDGKLVHEVRDLTFKSGGIGVGSFDDTGRIGRVMVWSPKAGVSRVGNPFN